MTYEELCESVELAAILRKKGYILTCFSDSFAPFCVRNRQRDVALTFGTISEVKKWLDTLE